MPFADFQKQQMAAEILSRRGLPPTAANVAAAMNAINENPAIASSTKSGGIAMEQLRERGERNPAAAARFDAIGNAGVNSIQMPGIDEAIVPTATAPIVSTLPAQTPSTVSPLPPPISNTSAPDDIASILSKLVSPDTAPTAPTASIPNTAAQAPDQLTSPDDLMAMGELESGEESSFDPSLGTIAATAAAGTLAAGALISALRKGGIDAQEVGENKVRIPAQNNVTFDFDNTTGRGSMSRGGQSTPAQALMDAKGNWFVRTSKAGGGANASYFDMSGNSVDPSTIDVASLRPLSEATKDQPRPSRQTRAQVESVPADTTPISRAVKYDNGEVTFNGRKATVYMDADGKFYVRPIGSGNQQYHDLQGNPVARPKDLQRVDTSELSSVNTSVDEALGDSSTLRKFLGALRGRR